MLSLTSVSASEVVIGDVADKFKVPCQRVHAVTTQRSNIYLPFGLYCHQIKDFDYLAGINHQQC